MKKKLANPFGGNSTPNRAVQNEPSPLPERGTGLKTGNAGERRGGNPRTDEERIVKHKEIVDDTSDSDEYITTEKDGVINMRKKGFENDKSLKQIWAEHRAKKRRTA